MVLYYGLLALETANNSVAATTLSSQRESLPKKSNMSSSSNSWIYTEDLKKRFEERYGDHRYIFVPIYIDRKTSRYNSSTTSIIPERFDGENSWIYPRSFKSTSKISSSSCCVTNQGYMRDELSIKNSSQKKFLSSKNKSTTSLNTTNNLIKNRPNIVVEEINKNHSIPLIKQNLAIPSNLTNDNSTLVNTKINNELTNMKSNTKHSVIHNNRLTRLRDFFFKSSTSSLSVTQ